MKIITLSQLEEFCDKHEINHLSLGGQAIPISWESTGLDFMIDGVHSFPFSALVEYNEQTGQIKIENWIFDCGFRPVSFQF